jgi:hypothetical protein
MRRKLAASSGIRTVLKSSATAIVRSFKKTGSNSGHSFSFSVPVLPGRRS